MTEVKLVTDKNDVLFALMREALGKTRKIESYMQNRKYYHRVLIEEGKTNG